MVWELDQKIAESEDCSYGNSTRNQKKMNGIVREFNDQINDFNNGI